MTRKELLDELSSNPAMRSTLEQVALSAQLKVSDLALAQLPMSIPETDSETPPQLLDLWKAPVHISPIEPGPLVSKTVSWGESEHPVGMMLIHNIYSWGSYCSITEMKERGWVCLATYATVGDEYGNKYPAPIQWRIYIQTPPGAGAYMIDIHLASFAIDERELTEFTHLYMGDERSGFQSVPLISKSDGTGVIGLFTIEGEQQDVLGAGAFGLMNPTAAMMLEVVDTQFCNFGGVTITRI